MTLPWRWRRKLLVRSFQAISTSLTAWAGTGATVPLPGGGDASAREWLRHSQVALMPEGEPDSVHVLRPLGAEVVAWGTDAVSFLDRPRELQQRMAAYRDIGVKALACNVWMLTATPRVLHADPGLREAICRDIEGVGIVPRWLDGTHEGVPSYWGCTNHPLFRAQLVARAEAGIQAGANLLHLDDHLGTAAAAEHSGGCFCEFCLQGFARWLQENGDAAELGPLGVEDLAGFDYRRFLHRRGLSSREHYDAAQREDRIPLRAEFMSYQREAAVAFVRELGRLAAEVAGRPVPVGVNAWNLAPTQLATASAADYFANEISHHGVEDLDPPRAYLLADALGKPVFSTGTGEDWIEVGRHDEVTRVRRWIATAHAFGHHFMYAWRKWGFSEATGTRWYQTPLETYTPLNRFITSHPSLFDDYKAKPQIGVLYDNRTRRAGQGDVAPLVRALHDAHYSVGLAVAGDDWLDHALDETQLARFELLILPPDLQLEGPQAEVLERWRRQGGRSMNWTDMAALPSRLASWVHLETDGRVWTLPRVRTDVIPHRFVIHLLNQQQAPDRDEMVPSGPVHLSVDDGFWGGHRPARATLHVPNSPSQVLPLETASGRTRVSVPNVDLWAVLEFD